jgi:hypothetical protein
MAARKFDPGYSFRSGDFRGSRHPDRAAAHVPSGTTEGQHPCARGTLCAAARNTEHPDGTKERIAAPTYQAFCQACTDRIVAALTDLPGAWARIEAEYGTPVRRSDQAVRVPFGPSVPIRLDLDALQREAPPVIGGWAARVRSVPGLQLSDPQHADPGTLEGFAEACRTLRLFPSSLLSLQPKWMTRTYRLPLDEDTGALIADLEILRAGDDFITVQVLCDGTTAGSEILGLQWRSAAVLGELRTKPQELIGVPCRADGCGRMSLVRADPPPDPDDPGWYSICLRCRDRMSEEDYRDWVALCAAYEKHRRTVPSLENLPGVA